MIEFDIKKKKHKKLDSIIIYSNFAVTLTWAYIIVINMQSWNSKLLLLVALQQNLIFKIEVSFTKNGEIDTNFKKFY